MKKRFIIILLAMCLKQISSVLRLELDKLIKQLYEKAKSTDVEFDDVLVEGLAELLDIDLD